MGPNPMWLASLSKMIFEHVKLHQDVHAQGTTMWGHGEQVTICKSRRESSEWNCGQQFLDLGLPVSRLRKWICVVETTQSTVFGYGRPRKLMHLPSQDQMLKAPSYPNVCVRPTDYIFLLCLHFQEKQGLYRKVEPRWRWMKIEALSIW